MGSATGLSKAYVKHYDHVVELTVDGDASMIFSTSCLIEHDTQGTISMGSQVAVSVSVAGSLLLRFAYQLRNIYFVQPIPSSPNGLNMKVRGVKAPVCEESLFPVFALFVACQDSVLLPQTRASPCFSHLRLRRSGKTGPGQTQAFCFAGCANRW